MGGQTHDLEVLLKPPNQLYQRPFRVYMFQHPKGLERWAMALMDEETPMRKEKGQDADHCPFI